MTLNAHYINTYIIYAMIIMLFFMLVNYIINYIITPKVRNDSKKRRFKRIFATEYDRNFI